ncbi:hypothetical protein M9458_017311, partial [Cirrhinus mrigala]
RLQPAGRARRGARQCPHLCAEQHGRVAAVQTPGPSSGRGPAGTAAGQLGDGLHRERRDILHRVRAAHHTPRAEREHSRARIARVRAAGVPSPITI